MLMSIEGVYRKGKIELAELPGHVPEEARVIVTFLDSAGVGRTEVIVRQIDNLRQQLCATYGTMPDSVDLVREDRTR